MEYQYTHQNLCRKDETEVDGQDAIFYELQLHVQQFLKVQEIVSLVGNPPKAVVAKFCQTPVRRVNRVIEDLSKLNDPEMEYQVY